MPRLTQKQQTSSERGEGGRAPPLDPANKVPLETELARYGITAVPITFFDWGGYRYSNAHDAVAAAKRGAKS